MSTASFIASQRTDHGVPCALACRALGVPLSTFYARINPTPPPARRRRDGIDAAVAESFEASGGTYGSPRVLADLRAEGWRVSKKTVESSMARQGLQGRRPMCHAAKVTGRKVNGQGGGGLCRCLARSCRKFGVCWACWELWPVWTNIGLLACKSSRKHTRRVLRCLPRCQSLMKRWLRLDLWLSVMWMKVMMFLLG